MQKLPCGVMVARRILVPPVRVRILPRQQLKELSSIQLSSFFFSTHPNLIIICIFVFPTKVLGSLQSSLTGNEIVGLITLNLEVF